MAYFNGKEWVSQITPTKTTTPKSPNFSQTTLDTQKKLNAENKGKPGYVPLVEDGIMGPKTMNAINASQFAPLPKTQTTPPPTPVAGTGAPIAAPATPAPTTNGTVVLTGGASPVPKTSVDTDIQDYIKEMNDAIRSEDQPHYNPNLVPLTAEEADEVIFEE